MALNPFIRNLAYFQDLREDENTINAKDMDDQFNDLVGYINSNITTAVNALAVNIITGILDSPGMLLFNRGVNGVEWAYIDNDAAILDNSLSWRKLENGTAGTILAAGLDNVFTGVIPTSDNQVLVSQKNNLPSWQLLNGDNFENRSITGNKLALKTITADNIYPGTLITTLIDNSVTEVKISANAFSTDKFADGSITLEKLGIFSDDLSYIPPTLFNGYIGNNHIKPQSITLDKIADGILTASFFKELRPITMGKLANSAVTDSKLLPINVPYQVLTSEVLANDFKVNGTHLINNQMFLLLFDPNTQAAMRAHGAT